MKATEQYIPVVLFIMLYADDCSRQFDNVFFEILKYVYYWAYFSVKLCIFGFLNGWNLMVVFKWKLWCAVYYAV